VSTTSPRQIVCDTGPLISLEKITGGYRFIERLYDQLIVPPAVMDELVAGQFETADAYLHHFHVEDLIVAKRLVARSTTREIEDKTKHLDKGEREAVRTAIKNEV
jgi:predicted nucleic acid-binding protein